MIMSNIASAYDTNREKCRGIKQQRCQFPTSLAALHPAQVAPDNDHADALSYADAILDIFMPK